MYYMHIKAHQDDHTSFKNFDRKAQLNCICDHAAKFRIATDGQDPPAPGELFPLKTEGVYFRGEKMTSDTGGSIRYWAHHQLARNYYQEQNILSHKQFDAIDWRSVHTTLHDLPLLFQLWASKHVLGIAGTMLSVAPRWLEPPVPKLPSMRRNVQAHRLLPRGRQGGCFSRVSERGREMDGDR